MEPQHRKAIAYRQKELFFTSIVFLMRHTIAIATAVTSQLDTTVTSKLQNQAMGVLSCYYLYCTYIICMV